MRQWVEHAVNLLVDIYDPDCVILFGSVLKQATHASSDIDLLVVGPSDLPPTLRDQAIVEQLNRFPVKFDLLFYTPDELEEALAVPYSFVSSIHSTWEIVYKKLEFGAESDTIKSV